MHRRMASCMPKLVLSSDVVNLMSLSSYTDPQSSGWVQSKSVYHKEMTWGAPLQAVPIARNVAVFSLSLLSLEASFLYLSHLLVRCPCSGDSPDCSFFRSGSWQLSEACSEDERCNIGLPPAARPYSQILYSSSLDLFPAQKSEAERAIERTIFCWYDV